MYLFNSSQQTLKEGKAYVIILVFSKPGLREVREDTCLMDRD